MLIHRPSRAARAGKSTNMKPMAPAAFAFTSSFIGETDKIPVFKAVLCFNVSCVESLAEWESMVLRLIIN